MSQDIEREREIAAGARRATSYPVPPVELVEALRGEHGAWVSEVVEAFGELTLVVPRFEVNYQLFSTKRYHRMRLKVLLSQEDVHVESVPGGWRTANWNERDPF